MKHISLNSPPWHDIRFSNYFSFYFQKRFNFSSNGLPTSSPQGHHLSCASLKPKNIIKLQRRKKKRVGGLSVCVLRVFEIKKLWQKQQQQQALGHRWSLDLILYSYLSKREIILICCVVIPIHLVSFQYEPYHKLKYAKSFINISEVFISL